MHGLEAEYWERIDFVYLDRESPGNREVVAQYGIRYQPVFILIEADGTEVTRWTVLSEEGMRAEMDAYLESAGGG